MPKKSNKRSNKGKVKGTRKQKPILMIGCSKKNKKSCKSKFFSTLGNKGCLKCGPNCHCGPNCKCSHPCPGNCYLNRRSKKQRGGTGSGCGSCGCPIGGLPTEDMNKFVEGNKPVLIEPPSTKVEYIPTPGIAQNGGSCGQCGQIPVTQNGGELPHFNFFKPAAPIPGPFVGSAWGAPVKEWPGVNGIGGDRNYLKSYEDTITNDPQQQMLPPGSDAGYNTLNSIVGGGYKYRKKSKRRRPKRVSFNLKRGGGLVPQDLVNLGRDFNYNLKSAYNTINGYEAPVSDLPYRHQLTDAFKTSFML